MNNALLITNLATGQTLTFKYFPTEINTTGRANWEPQDVSHGVKPLLYRNNDPRKLDFALDLDDSVKGNSITPHIKALMALLEETKEGAPAPLVVLWGDRQERVVLEEVKVTETQPFADDGVPLRAKVNLSFIQVQDDGRTPKVVKTNVG